MNQTLRSLLIFIALLFGGAYVLLNFVAGPALVKLVNEKKIPTFAQDVKVDSIKFKISTSFISEVYGLNIIDKDVKIHIKAVQIKTSFIWKNLILLHSPFINIEVNLPDPSIELIQYQNKKNSVKESNEKILNANHNPQIALIWQKYLSPIAKVLNINVQVRNAQFLLLDDQSDSQLVLDKVNINLSFRGIANQSEITVSGNASSKYFSFYEQIQFELKSFFELKNDLIEVKDSNFTFGGVSFKIKGWSQLSSNVHSYRITSQITDLKTHSANIIFLPSGIWSGSLSAQLNLDKKQGEEIKVSGDWKFDRVSGQLLVRNKSTIASGPLALSSSGSFKMENAVWLVPQVFFSLDASGVELEIKNKLRKPKDTPCFVEFSAQGDDQKLIFRKLNGEFLHIKISGSGYVGLKEKLNSYALIHISKFSLKELVEYIPFLEEMPPKGTAEADISVSGELLNPSAMRISFDPIKLSGASAYVNWASADNQIKFKGPFHINLNLSGSVSENKIIEIKGDGQGDFTKLEVNYDNQFIKDDKTPLRSSFKISQKNNSIKVSSLSMVLNNNLVGAVGSVTLLKKPKSSLFSQYQINSVVNVKQVNVGDIRKIYAQLPESIPNLKLSGSLNIDGVYDLEKNVLNNDIAISGVVNAELVEYIMKIQSNSKKLLKDPNEIKNPTPIWSKNTWVDKYPILAKSKLNGNLNLDKLIITKFTGTNASDSLAIQNSKWTYSLSNGAVELSGLTKNFISGELKVKKLTTNLFEPNSSLKANIELKSFDVVQAINWWFPEWQDALSGKLSGSLNITVPHLSDVNYKSKIRVSGNASFQDGFISAKPLDQIINEALMKIPGLGNQSLSKNTGIRSTVTTDFEFDGNKISLSKVKMKTSDKNELEANGELDLDKNINLTGTAYLMNVPIFGEVREANSDAQGRLVIPLRINGNLLKPKLEFAQATIDTMLKRTTEHAAKKALNRAQAQVKENIQNEIEKGKNKLEEQFQKGLNDFINRK